MVILLLIIYYLIFPSKNRDDYKVELKFNDVMILTSQIKIKKRRERFQNQNPNLMEEKIKLLFEFNRGRNPMFNSGYIGVLSI